MMKRFLSAALALATFFLAPVMALIVAPGIAPGTAEAAEVQHAVCLKARNGKFLDISGGGTDINAKNDTCSGGAVLVFEDKTGGALMGGDKVYIGSIGLATRWGTDGGSGVIGHAHKGYKGGTENFTLHRKAGNGVPVTSGEEVYLNAYTGKWVYDSGGAGPLRATSGAAGGGETFTLVFASTAAANVAKRAQAAAIKRDSNDSGDGYHRVCLLTRGGHYVTFTSGAPQVNKDLKSCTGNAVLHWRDDPGAAALNGEDRFFFYNAKRNDTWLKNMNVHLKDRSKRAVKSGDEIHINGTGGTWVNDNGGNGPLINQSRSLGAGETFTLIFAPAVDTAQISSADDTAKATANKAAPRAEALPGGGGGDSLKFGDTVVIRYGNRYLSADQWGRVSVSDKPDTAFQIYDENGGGAGQPVKLWEKPVTLRVAKSHRWLQSSKDEDTGLIYRYANLRDVYNFNWAETGHNNNINNVLIWRPKLPAGWVFLGDSVFRYQDGDAYNDVRLNAQTLIFKDHPTAFRKPSGYFESWADGNSGNGRLKNGRGAMARAKKGGGYEWIGSTFFTEWCCTGLGQARLIHQKYGAWLPLPQFWDTGGTQWTARWQKYTREATAAVYDGGALIDLPDGKKFPLMWSHRWGFPMDCRSCWKGGGGRAGEVGNPGFLNGRFLKEFSYYAGPFIMRSRPGAGDAGNAPGDVTRARFKLINPDIAKWSDTSPVDNGASVKISHVQSDLCRGQACSLNPTASQVITNRRYQDAAAWSITRIDPAKVASRAITFKPTTGSPNEGGSGGTPHDRFGLAGGWRDYGRDYAGATIQRSGNLVSLQGMAIGGNRGRPVAGLPKGARPSGILIFPANNHGRTARVDVHPDGRVVWGAGGGGYGGWLSLSNMHFTARGGRGLPLNNGWRNFGGGYAPARVDKIGNTVIVTGMIKGSHWGHVATLPAGHRPPGRLIFSINHHESQARLDIHPDGRIVWIAGGRQHGWISLSGIVFSVSPDRPITINGGGWRNFGRGYRVAEVTKIGNTVILSGMIRGTVPGGRAVNVGQLPSGYRPKKRLVFNVNGHDATARVDIFRNGNIQVVTGTGKHDWATLSGIVFSTK